MPNVAEALAQGRAFHEAGKLDDAERCYLQVLAADPQNVEAQLLLAIAYRALGKRDEAIAGFRRGLQLHPGYAEGHFDLGVLLAARGELAEAEQCFRRAVEMRPQWAEAHSNLGAMLTKRNQPAAALQCFQTAVALRPDYVDALNNLGVLLADEKRFDEAIGCHRRAIELSPNFADAHSNLAASLFQLGNLVEAEALSRRALALRPDYFDAEVNLGAALTSQNRFEEAESAYRRAMELRPLDGKVMVNFGVLFEKQGKLDLAEAWFRKALELNPNLAEAHNNLADAFVTRNELGGAMDSLSEALALNPRYAEAHRNRALVLLLSGRFEEGWAEYEWRFRCQGFAGRFADKPRWQGQRDAGARVLIHSEQGLGDTLQFIRYAELVKERCSSVIVECEPPLVRLVATCPGVDKVVPRGEPLPEIHFQIPMLSLPGVFHTTLDNIPAKVPYLWPDQALIEQRRTELGSDASFKVGVAWSGNRDHPKNRLRSIPVPQFVRLANVEGVRLFSLQTGAGREDLAALGPECKVTDLGDRLGDFHDTGALVRNLDLVITCDSSPAHLAGSIGVPVWVALNLVPDWRWLVDRDDCPWYPTMRLFRQTGWGNWQGVFERIYSALVAQVNSQRPERS